MTLGPISYTDELTTTQTVAQPRVRTLGSWAAMWQSTPRKTLVESGKRSLARFSDPPVRGGPLFGVGGLVILD